MIRTQLEHGIDISRNSMSLRLESNKDSNFETFANSVNQIDAFSISWVEVGPGYPIVEGSFLLLDSQCCILVTIF
jgi:hypothetical protein